MKHILKKVMLFVTTLTLVAGITLANTQTVEAATPVMKKVNVKWDLKNNKTLTYKTRYAGIGMKNQKVKISNLKIKNSTSKPGYKECTLTISFTTKWKMKKSEVHSIVNAKDADMGGICHFAVVDYDTGKSLLRNNNKGVTVTSTKGWTYSKSTTYKDSDGCWVRLSNPSIKLKITYPKNYKGLCIGVGGSTRVDVTKNDTKFSEGKVAFNKTSRYSKKDKMVSHFMRIK